MLPGDTVLFPSAPRHGSKATVAAKKCQPMLMPSVAHTGDAHIYPGDTQPWTCPLHSFVGHRGLCSSWSLLHFLYLMLQSGSLNKPPHPVQASPNQDCLLSTPCGGHKGKWGAEIKHLEQHPPILGARSAPGRGHPTASLQHGQELQKIPVLCTLHLSLAGICAEMWFLWDPGYPQPRPACGMLNGQMAQPGLSHTWLPQCW